MKNGVLNTVGMLGIGLMFSSVSWAQEESWKISENDIEAPVEVQDGQNIEAESESVSAAESETSLPSVQTESGVAPKSYAAPQSSGISNSNTYVNSNSGYMVNNQQESGNTSSVIQVTTGGSADTGVQDESNTQEPEPMKYWQSGVGFVLGLGPDFDIYDPGAGLTGRIGFGVHGRYFGASLDVSWTVVWAYKSAKRSDALEMPYKASNAGVEVVLSGYIPVSTHVVVDLGLGFGFGHKSETIFSNYSYKEDGSSWLSHFYIGSFWSWGDWTLGLDLEFNLNNYLNEGEYRYWSDGKMDLGIGLVFKGSYQINGF